MAETTGLRSLFRAFSKEIKHTNLQAKPSSSRRTDPLPTYVRQLIRKKNQESSSRVSEKKAAALRSRMQNIFALIHHTRVHGQLLARYNPVYGKSEQERIKATANRVGLDVPKEYIDAQLQSAKDGELDAKH